MVEDRPIITKRFVTLYKLPVIVTGSAKQVDLMITPCEFPTRLRSSVVGRDGCSIMVGRHNRRSKRADAATIASEPNPDARAHSTVDKTDYRILAWRSPPCGDRRCSSHLLHQSGQMYEEHNYTASPSPQFAVPQRGRKRLSREATLHAVLALE